VRLLPHTDILTAVDDHSRGYGMNVISEAIHEEISPDPNIRIDENEVDQIKESILEAQYFDAIAWPFSLPPRW
jgi:hypothetical protein